jgi:hypothetical protein
MARSMPRKIRHWLAVKYSEIPLVLAGLRARSGGRGVDGRPGGIRPENVVWIFGSGRSGSTWLRSMMGDMGRHQVWEEPLVGRLFGEFYDRAQKSNLRRPDFVMGDATRKGWIKSIRNFVLDGAKYARPRLGPDNYLVVKEPNGSMGAPLLMEALPESRMILLLRDPRDVGASTLDAARKGGWLHAWVDEKAHWRQNSLADSDPDAFVEMNANVYLQQVGSAKRAYEAHKGPRALVRYEELVADTLATMRRLYEELGLAVDEGELSRVVRKRSWEMIPEEKKGEGKFYRKASPGSWREDLTPEQVRIIERVTAPLLARFYSDDPHPLR